MYNICSFPTERLSSETVFYTDPGIKHFQWWSAVKRAGGGEKSEIFSRLLIGKTQYTAVQKKQLREATAVRMKKSEE